MPKIVDLPYYVINSRDLATWIDGQPEIWWYVDGDHILMSRVDFPCPSNELAEELRRINKPLWLFDPRSDSIAHGGPLPLEELPQIADTANNSRAKTYLLCWDGDDAQWLLGEDPRAMKEPF